ncbi:hypothetical protein [Klugiella xanthotipulae]|uniref:hypothetical protein n=1 Tax=Klugiella xanthotipulae TaxID=244735 RepID=UPI0014771990|nr:hypothetical protein [Klugiella xanthotipulae]
MPPPRISPHEEQLSPVTAPPLLMSTSKAAQLLTQFLGVLRLPITARRLVPQGYP